MSAEVLIVDDEVRIREVVRYALEREGFVVHEVGDGKSALRALEGKPVDLVVLDVMLPEMDGLDVCRKLRGNGRRTPILFLSARAEEIDRVLGLELGGDDYLTKPFSPRELVARVRAILRRAETPDTDGPVRVLRHRAVKIDLDRHQVQASASEIALTPTELGVLAALLERPGIVLSRAQLMHRAYTYDNLVTERTIDTHVRRIRRKFRDAGAVDPIATVHGVGYKASEL